jgi:hypothetical protein
MGGSPRPKRLRRARAPVIHQGPHAPLLHQAGRRPRWLSFGRVIRVLSAGNHHPLLCQLEDEQGDTGLWVVKTPVVVSKSTGRQEFFVVSELAGAEVCARAGVGTPAVGLLRFPERAPAELMKPAHGGSEVERELEELFALNRGKLAFCSRYIVDAVDVRAEVLRTRAKASSVLAAAAGLLLADVFMRHDDREAENPNCVWYGWCLVAIDHGLAFGGLDGPGATGDSVAARVVLSAPMRRHVSLRALAGHSGHEAWAEASGRLASWPEEAIDRFVSGLPEELDLDGASTRGGLKLRMGDFLRARRRYLPEMRDAIVRLLEAKS